MTGKRHSFGDGLMAFYSDIEKDYVPRYRQWHNCEHIPERVSIPGFIEGRRYHGCEGASDFLMTYETDTAEVLESKAYLGALDKPTEWTREALTHFRKPRRGIYRLLSAYGESDFFTAPWLLSIRLDGGEITSQGAEAVLEDIQNRGAPSARFYGINDHIARIVTTEKKIYGEGVPYRRHLILIEHKGAGERKDILENRRKGAL
ncbi:MAG: hypothetical protein ACC661_10320, partial [Verrucomicrobiales bacterium]